MYLTAHFTLDEMIYSHTADRLGIDNHPNDEEVHNLTHLCEAVLEPVRAQFGLFSPTSGYRCAKLEHVLTKDAWILRGFKSFNDYLKVKSHPKGQAADFKIRNVSNVDLARWIESSLKFDQLILEFYNPQIQGSGWVHCSWQSYEANRNQILTIGPSGVKLGIVE